MIRVKALRVAILLQFILVIAPLTGQCANMMTAQLSLFECWLQRPMLWYVPGALGLLSLWLQLVRHQHYARSGIPPWVSAFALVGLTAVEPLTQLLPFTSDLEGFVSVMQYIAVPMLLIPQLRLLVAWQRPLELAAVD